MSACQTCGAPADGPRTAYCGPAHRTAAKKAQDARSKARRPSHPRSARLRLDDVDEVAVMRAVDGWPVPLNRGERRAAVAILARRGLTSGPIAERIGVTGRTVQRDRIALRVAA